MGVGRVLGYALMVVLTGLIVVRWFSLDRVAPLVQAVVLVPYLSLASLLATLILFGTGRRGLGMWALVVTVAYAGALLPRWAVAPKPVPQGTPLRVMTANLQDGGADAGDLIWRIRQQHPDLLSVQELTPGAASALQRAGIGRYLPNQVLRAAPKDAGTGLYSRLPLTNGRSLSRQSTFDLARADMSVGRVRVDTVAVDTRPPLLGSSTPDWYRDLSLLPHPTAPGMQLLAGNFNGTEDQRGFRNVVDLGYRDAAISVGRGLKPTWSQWTVPPISIDHVLTERSVSTTAVRTYPLPGSDHRILMAELVLTS